LACGALSVVNFDLDAEDECAVAVDDLLATEAGRLFVDRAQLVLASFSLTSENAAAVAQICRRLAGILLALELAAARLTALGLDQITDSAGPALSQSFPDQ
jgi:predicted ATPase